MQVLSTQGERTNDIARSVQNGDTDILVLWLACRRLVMQTARRWHRAFNGSRGVVLDDLEQVGFLALTWANRPAHICFFVFSGFCSPIKTPPF